MTEILQYAFRRDFQYHGSLPAVVTLHNRNSRPGKNAVFHSSPPNLVISSVKVNSHHRRWWPFTDEISTLEPIQPFFLIPATKGGGFLHPSELPPPERRHSPFFRFPSPRVVDFSIKMKNERTACNQFNLPEFVSHQTGIYYTV